MYCSSPARLGSDFVPLRLSVLPPEVLGWAAHHQRPTEAWWAPLVADALAARCCLPGGIETAKLASDANRDWRIRAKTLTDTKTLFCETVDNGSK